MTKIKSICVYCGSQPGVSPEFSTQAIKLGQEMAKYSKQLVYGGGTRGLMGDIARSVHEADGHVTGIIPEFLLEHEADHKPELYCNEVIVTADMHERKQKMFEKSDAFIAMPGGVGTLEELVEIMTWAQLGRHAKPIGLLNVGGFWNPFNSLIDHMSDSGFIHTQSNLNLIVMNDASELDKLLSGH